MSTYGRAQDALWDILWGTEDGEGKFHPGPMHLHEPKEVSEMIDRIIDVVANIMQGELA